MNSVNPFIATFFAVVIAVVAWWLGNLLLTAAGAPAIFSTILLALIVLALLWFAYQLFVNHRNTL